MMIGEVSMPADIFSRFAETDRLWVYGFSRPLTDTSIARIENTLRAFIPTWTSHGLSVDGAFFILENRFALLTGGLREGISGCSIDSSVRCFKELKDSHHLDGLDRSLVFYRDAASSIQSVSFFDFQHLVENGIITSKTRVFDNTIESIGHLRRGKFEVNFENSWHVRRFRSTARTNT
jgi:hypothetical protein